MEMQDEPKSPLPAQSQQKPGLDSKMDPQARYLAPLYKGAEKLKGKVALITGGDSGIGRSVAVLYAREGADVAIVYLAPEQPDAEETKRAVEAEGGRCLLLCGNVTEQQFCKAAVAHTIREFGKLDILVNNAAYQQEQTNFEDITEEQFDITFKTNIYGYFYMIKAALPHLKAGSAIINTGSVAGQNGNPNLVDYAATKAAIHGFTKSLAQNIAERKIRVNCVAPGPVWTPLQPVSKSPRSVAEHGADNPMCRPGQPEEISPAFVFLASEADSSYMSGEIIVINGADPSAA